VAVLPPVRAPQLVVDQVVEMATTLCRALNVKGFLNVQFVAVGEDVYVIEANPRSSRTVPFLIKATGIPLVDLAIDAALGNPWDGRWGTGLTPPPPYYSVKMPVFSFSKLVSVDAVLGPEMKSTGEVMGIDMDFGGALYKALIGAGFRLPAGGRILVTVADQDKVEALPILAEFATLGYHLYATSGTLASLSSVGVAATPVYVLESDDHIWST